MATSTSPNERHLRVPARDDPPARVPDFAPPDFDSVHYRVNPNSSHAAAIVETHARWQGPSPRTHRARRGSVNCDNPARSRRSSRSGFEVAHETARHPPVGVRTAGRRRGAPGGGPLAISGGFGGRAWAATSRPPTWASPTTTPSAATDWARSTSSSPPWAPMPTRSRDPTTWSATACRRWAASMPSSRSHRAKTSPARSTAAAASVTPQARSTCRPRSARPR